MRISAFSAPPRFTCVSFSFTAEAQRTRRYAEGYIAGKIEHLAIEYGPPSASLAFNRHGSGIRFGSLELLKEVQEQMKTADFGTEAFTEQDRAYHGSRFSEVRDAIFANPYRDPMPADEVTL